MNDKLQSQKKQWLNIYKSNIIEESYLGDYEIFEMIGVGTFASVLEIKAFISSLSHKILEIKA